MVHAKASDGEREEYQVDGRSRYRGKLYHLHLSIVSDMIDRYRSKPSLYPPKPDPKPNMDPKREAFEKEEDVLQLKENYLALPKGQISRDGILDDRTIDPSAKEFSEAPEGSAGRIHEQGQDEESRLRSLATHVRDQDELERDVGRQVGQEIPATIYVQRISHTVHRRINYSSNKPMSGMRNVWRRPNWTKGIQRTLNVSFM